MDFALTESQELIKKEVGALARTFSLDYWLDIDSKAEYPHEFVRERADELVRVLGLGVLVEPVVQRERPGQRAHVLLDQLLRLRQREIHDGLPGGSGSQDYHVPRGLPPGASVAILAPWRALRRRRPPRPSMTIWAPSTTWPAATSRSSALASPATCTSPPPRSPRRSAGCGRTGTSGSRAARRSG